MTQNMTLSALMLLGGLMTAGCQSPGSGNDTAASLRLAPSPVPFFSDIPMPAGFKQVHERSMDLVSGKIRLVRHVYTGRGGLVAVRDFYCEQMPLGRWREVNRQFEEGLFTLRFEKENEGCEVRFRAQSGFTPQTEINVVVMPRNLTEAPPSVKASTGK